MARQKCDLQCNPGLLGRYMALKQPDNLVIVQYVWIDGKQGVRAKSRTMATVPKSPNELPLWNFDGSSTWQAEGGNSDIYLYPGALYMDPFRGGNNRIVLCETIRYDKTPLPSNTRNSCKKAMDQVAHEEPWFGIEQEYSLLDGYSKNHPLGWPSGGFPGPQGPYYCGIGTNKVYGRDVIESHYRVCTYAGVKIAGENAEVMPSQWEYQVGPCRGISIGDDMWMSRFFLWRVAEDWFVGVTFDPKPIPGDWNGAGGHTNFSTKSMREDGGMKVIDAACQKLAKRHKQHLSKYDASGGKDNERRLTGRHETSSMDQFSYGVANRGASVRIPRQCADEGKGYLEDRRPASNMDPYVVCEMMIRTICLGESDDDDKKGSGNSSGKDSGSKDSGPAGGGGAGGKDAGKDGGSGAQKTQKIHITANGKDIKVSTSGKDVKVVAATGKDNKTNTIKTKITIVPTNTTSGKDSKGAATTSGKEKSSSATKESKLNTTGKEKSSSAAKDSKAANSSGKEKPKTEATKTDKEEKSKASSGKDEEKKKEGSSNARKKSRSRSKNRRRRRSRSRSSAKPKDKEKDSDKD